MENEFIYIDGKRIDKSIAKESENLLKQLEVALWILEEKGITTGRAQIKSAIKKATRETVKNELTTSQMESALNRSGINTFGLSAAGIKLHYDAMKNK